MSSRYSRRDTARVDMSERTLSNIAYSPSRTKRSPARTPTKPAPGKSPKRSAKPTKAEASKSDKVEAKKSDKIEAKKSPKVVGAKKPPKSEAKKPARKTPTRSPVKKAGSPARRIGQPIKYTKEQEAVIKLVPVINMINLADSESDSDSPTTSSIQTRSKRTLSKEPSVEILNSLRSRAPLKEKDDHVVHTRSTYEPVKRLHEFSDEDETDHSKPTSPTTKPHISMEQIGLIVVTLAYLFGELSLTYLIPLLCTDRHCEFAWLGRKDWEKIPASFNLSVLFSVFAFVIFNGIISIVNFGGKKHHSLVPADRFEYITNGLFALVLQILILVALEIYHIPVTTYLTNNFFALITASVIFSFVLGIVLFAKSFYAKNKDLAPDYETRPHIVNFILGCEINPRFGPLDVKFVVVRCFLIGFILIVLSFVYQSMEMISIPPRNPKVAVEADVWALNMQLLQSIRIRPTLLVLSSLMMIYISDSLVFENTFLSMMEFKTVPWGFLKSLEYLTGTVIYGMFVKYVYDFNVELEGWELGLCSALFLVGFALYRGSNSQKHAFRENPYSLLAAKYESIPTGTGKKILCSGYWGFVRHPNYLGDILLTLSFARFVWPSPNILLLVFIVGHLILRAYIDNKKCRQRYGVAWDRYCQRVPSLLIPKVF